MSRPSSCHENSRYVVLMLGWRATREREREEVKEGGKKLIRRSPGVSRGNDKKRDTLNATRVVTLTAVLDKAGACSKYVRSILRDLSRRSVATRNTVARYFLIMEYFPGNKGTAP